MTKSDFFGGLNGVFASVFVNC